MHGVATILPQPFHRMVEDIWDELETRHGLSGIRVTPYPHFSWQIGEEYDQEKMSKALSQIAARTKPFTVFTTGLGLFTGAVPVIFIPVVKTQELLDLHRQVWEALAPVTTGCSPYYSPSMWVPHISIAYADVTMQNIGPVMQTLAFRSFNWEFLADNFVFIYEPQGTIGEMLVNLLFSGK